MAKQAQSSLDGTPAAGVAAAPAFDPSAATAQSVTRLRVPPSAVLVAGADYASDESDPYYDGARTSAPLDGALTADIAARGVQSPVVARLDNGRLVCVDGRRRVLHARAAGVTDIPVEVMEPDPSASGRDLYLFARRANAFRVDESPLEQAENCERAKRLWNVKVKDFAAYCGLSAHDMSQRLSLLKLTPELRAALAKGELAYSHAWQLSKLPAEKQTEVYARLSDAGALTTQAIRREKSAEGEGAEGEGEKVKRPGLPTSTLRKIVAMHEADELPDLSDEVVSAFKVVVGLLNPRKVKGLAKAINTLEGRASELAEKRAARAAAKSEAPAE
jgi:ParB/RepB/Spo0J family partition protein